MLIHNLPFCVVRRDRGSVGGGLAIFIRSNIIHTVVKVCPNAEALCIDVGCSELRFVLGYIPNGQNDSSILNMCNFLKSVISREAVKSR